MWLRSSSKCTSSVLENLIILVISLNQKSASQQWNSKNENV